MTLTKILALATGMFVAGLARAQDTHQLDPIASTDMRCLAPVTAARPDQSWDLFLRGTSIAATARGRARVEYRDGIAEVHIGVEGLPEPASLGPYTTYVIWALCSDGRATKQGVLEHFKGGNGEMRTTYGAARFALMVTAEPHFAVRLPSTMLALYSGDYEPGATTLTGRVDYASLGRQKLSRITITEDNPLEVVQARYSIALARSAGADRLKLPSYVLATQKLAAAEAALQRRNSSERRQAPSLAREAVIAGEVSRYSAALASTHAAAGAETTSR